MTGELASPGSGPAVAIIGGGPAGLTAAYELQKLDAAYRPVVLESGDIVGGIARTEVYKGFRFDIGGHRFFTKEPEVQQMWQDVLGGDFITRPRRSRIFYRGRFYDYPLKIMNALYNIGPYEAARIVLSYLKWQIRPNQREDSFEQWVINRFGGRLYMHFFRSYTQKVWGISPRNIQAEWAEQRIKNLSLYKALLQALTGANDTASLIEEFKYPRLGPGMMWEKVTDLVRRAGGEVRTRNAVERVFRDGSRVTGLEVAEWSPGGETRRYRLPTQNVISSMALRDLIERFDPPPPRLVCDAAARLKYRDFLIVTLVLDRPDPFPDNWIYVHSSDVRVGRIQNFRAWSPEMTPNDRQASIGMEYFCRLGDELWETDDQTLIRQAASELETLGLASAQSVVDGTVIRQPKAYPVYDNEYKAALGVISDWIRTLENFQTVGRNGLHRYNNQDHSMLSAMLAARNITGERHDVWNVNTERSYHEEFERPNRNAGQAAA